MNKIKEEIRDAIVGGYFLGRRNAKSPDVSRFVTIAAERMTKLFEGLIADTIKSVDNDDLIEIYNEIIEELKKRELLAL